MCGAITGYTSQLQDICGRYGVYVSSDGFMWPLRGIRVKYIIHMAVTGYPIQLHDVYESITGYM